MIVKRFRPFIGTREGVRDKIRMGGLMHSWAGRGRETVNLSSEVHRPLEKKELSATETHTFQDESVSKDEMENLPR